MWESSSDTWLKQDSYLRCFCLQTSSQGQNMFFPLELHSCVGFQPSSVLGMNLAILLQSIQKLTSSVIFVEIAVFVFPLGQHMDRHKFLKCTFGMKQAETDDSVTLLFLVFLKIFFLRKGSCGFRSNDCRIGFRLEFLARL